MNNPKRMQIKIDVSLIKQGKKYVVYSPGLDISTYGNNLAEAKKRFSELLDVFFAEHDEKHVLETVLIDLGWVKKKQLWEKDKKFLEGGLKDSFGSLEPLSKEEYEYYMSLPEKKDVEAA